MRRITSFLIVFAMLVLSMCTFTISAFAEENGSEENPYIITDVAGFLAIKSGASGTWYELQADIDLGETYAPFIFNGNLKGAAKPDGSKYKITYTVSETNRYAGLFTQFSGKISNIHVIGTATDARLSGGIAGQLLSGGVIDNCICDINITVTESIGGGVAGQMESGSVIKNTTVSGTITGPAYIGGIVGNTATGGTVENCVVKSGTVISATGKNIGGIFGYAGTGVTITNCKNAASVISTSSVVGGIVGYASGSSISKCVNEGSISGSTYVAGIGADIRGTTTIENCMNTGSVTAPVGSGLAAGIVASAADANTKVNSCLNSGVITAKVNYLYPVGTYNNKGTVTNSYYTTPENQFTSVFTGSSEITDIKWQDMIAKNELPEGFSTDIWEYVPVDNENSYPLPQIKTNKCNDSEYAFKVLVDNVNYGGGLGVIDIPYVIKNATHFANISKNPSAYYILEDSFTVSTPVAEFSGDFNGNGKTVKLDIVSTSGNAGLFSTITGDAKIYNLTLTGSVKGATNVGSVVGLASGTTANSKIYDITNNATVDAVNNAGGIIGHINTSSPAGKTVVENCHNYNLVNSTNGAAGGIVALSSGQVTKCSNNANVTGYTQVGGIVGFAYASISNSYNTGKIIATRTGHNNTLCGGIAGAVRSAAASIDTCYNLGSVVSDCANGITSSSSHASGSVVIKNTFNLGAVIRNDGTQPAYSLLNEAWTTTIENVYYLTKTAYDDKDDNTINITDITEVANIDIEGYVKDGAYPVISDNAQKTLDTFIVLTTKADENGSVKLSNMSIGDYYIKSGEAHTLSVAPIDGYMASVSVNGDIIFENGLKAELLSLSPFVSDTEINIMFSERPATDVSELKITTPVSVFVPSVIADGDEYTIKNQDGEFTVKSGLLYGATFSKINNYFGWNIVEFGIEANGEKYPSKLTLTDSNTYGIIFEGLKDNIAVKSYVVYSNVKTPTEVVTVYGEEAILEVE